MRDNAERKDRSGDCKALSNAEAAITARELEIKRTEQFLADSKANFDAWLNCPAVPYWGTERK